MGVTLCADRLLRQLAARLVDRDQGVRAPVSVNPYNDIHGIVLASATSAQAPDPGIGMPPLSQPFGDNQHDGQTPGLRLHHHAVALLRHDAHRSGSSRAPPTDLDTLPLSQLCDAASS
jgi:hypothetical protein